MIQCPKQIQNSYKNTSVLRMIGQTAQGKYQTFSSLLNVGGGNYKILKRVLNLVMVANMLKINKIFLLMVGQNA